MSGSSDFNDATAAYGPGRVFDAIQGATPPGDDQLQADEWPDLNLQQADDTPAPFPANSLPAALLSAVESAALFTKTDVASPAVVGLAVAATAIGKDARIEERPGLYHHPSLFFSIIADSGERKSPVFKIMTSPLERWADDQNESYSREVATVQAENAVVDSLLASMKRQASKETSEEKRAILVRRMAEETARKKIIPPSPRIFTSDTTEEKLFQKMYQHGGEYSVLSGEGRQVFDAILGRYSGSNRTGDGLYLAGISGDSITRDRVGNAITGAEDLAITNPCLNVCVMVQPDKFQDVLCHPALRESGLVARILPVKPRSLIGTRFEAPDEAGLNESAMMGYYRTITGFLDTRRPVDSMTGRRIPHLAKLGIEAKEARRQWHNVVESEMGNGQELESCRDIAAKAVTQAVKIALILHLLEHPDYLRVDQSEVSLATWKSAQSLAEFFLETAIRFRDATQAAESDAHRLVDWLKKTKRPTVTIRDVLRDGLRPRLRYASEVELVLDQMHEQGVVRKHLTKDEWQVNPALFVALSPCRQ
ncbi:MAG: YfjI family protein [Magnetococcus sp. DMHC-8]